MKPERAIDNPEIRRLAESGVVAKQIAVRLGIADTTVYKAAKVHNFPLPPDPRAISGGSKFWSRHEAEVQQFLREGLSCAEIGRRIGKTKNAVIGWLDRCGGRKKERNPFMPKHKPYIEFPPARCCVWPHGHPPEPGFHFCGAPTAPEKSYCAEHHRAAYRVSLNPMDCADAAD